MSLMVAIDFTRSNGHQNLHYLSHQCSQYQQAIRTLAILLEEKKNHVWPLIDINFFLIVGREDTRGYQLFQRNKGFCLTLSIIIAGFGLADFIQMGALDADSRVVKNSQGEAAKRDIVKFVSLCDYSNLLKDANGNVIGFTDTNSAELSKEALKEITQQFVSYVKHYNLLPHKLTDTVNTLHTIYI
ncbi:hypothetical protein RFI_36917 [Reticulomyxa filosa]|uniref:Copine C-terminal domain-containing protein n=1 Tax=Reticulomyxa filosa TaxID=46433 RepID=X6LEV5_RETFI|nr:hypothetical protein RFI_36917 [Reticulomyxa filosa]|eukprot:ETO00523.1 hypothetical protein RFI_36917 [Reticulomyxa filosa]